MPSQESDLKDVQLVRLGPTIEESLANNPAYINAMVRDDWTQVATLVHQLVGLTLTADPASVNELAWDGYLVVDTDTREIVGSCAFKGRPADDGSVEIAYFTYPGFEGSGYATQMALRLIALATTCPTVNRALAHTLRQANASTRVLEKVGMTFVGEVTDPDDGPVWQWQKQLRV